MAKHRNSCFVPVYFAASREGGSVIVISISTSERFISQYMFFLVIWGSSHLRLSRRHFSFLDKDRQCRWLRRRHVYYNVQRHNPAGWSGIGIRFHPQSIRSTCLSRFFPTHMGPFFGGLVSDTAMFLQWNFNEVYFSLPWTRFSDHPESRMFESMFRHEPILIPSRSLHWVLCFFSWSEAAAPLRIVSMRALMGGQLKSIFFYYRYWSPWLRAHR